MDTITRRAKTAEIRSRKNFVRRIYRNNKLFALGDIRDRYPDYTEAMLLEDMRMKSKRQKGKNTSP